jgi:hypothetical protein
VFTAAAADDQNFHERSCAGERTGVAAHFRGIVGASAAFERAITYTPTARLSSRCSPYCANAHRNYLNDENAASR